MVTPSSTMASTTSLLLTLASLARALPQGYQGGEVQARGIMDEALKKFYFDLYDQDQEPHPALAPPTADTHAFNIDEYFDTAEAGPSSTPGPRLPASRSTRVSSFPSPRPKQQYSVSPPGAPAPSQVGVSPVTPAPAAPLASAQDPTFVLSRLLFHLAQLPPASAAG